MRGQSDPVRRKTTRRRAPSLSSSSSSTPPTTPSSPATAPVSPATPVGTATSSSASTSVVSSSTAFTTTPIRLPEGKQSLARMFVPHNGREGFRLRAVPEATAAVEHCRVQVTPRLLHSVHERARELEPTLGWEAAWHAAESEFGVRE